MGRGDLSNEQWAKLEPLLPKGIKSGRPPKWSKRQLIDGIRWRTRTGAPWRDAPARYGPWQTVYGLFQTLAARRHLATDPHRVAGPGGRRGADHLGGQRGHHHRPAHQHAAGARKRGTGNAKNRAGSTPSRPTTAGGARGWAELKLHLAVEQGQRPLAVVVTAGQRGDAPQFETVMAGIRVRGWGRAAHGPGQIGSGLTRPTAPARSAGACADAGSTAPSRA